VTRAQQEIIDRLHKGVDPFAGFVPNGWADPADEWDSHNPLFDECVAELRPPVIVEVGSFLGVSSRHFAAALQREQIDGVVVCIDTWLAETVLLTNPQWRPHLRITNGRPEVFKVWMANALASGLQGYLCPMPIDSRSGARYLKACHVHASLVYVDASHIQGDVYADLELYWDLVLRPGGILLADDYQETPEFMGVIHDVQAFAAARGLPLKVQGTKALLRKPS
jgi:hypothetical protein